MIVGTRGCWVEFAVVLLVKEVYLDLYEEKLRF